MSKLVIFGAGKYAETAHLYFSSDSPHEVVAFTTDAEYLLEREKFGLPVVPFAEVQSHFPPGAYKMFVAIGYQRLNRLRAAKYLEAKAKGYELASYFSSRASNPGRVAIGDNCLVLDYTVIQPGAHVGSDVFLWTANVIGHHSVLGDHTYIAGNVVISGGTVIEPYCFVGVSATLGHEITIGSDSFIGAGALITKSAAPHSVYLAPDTQKYRLDAESFLRLTKMV